MCFNWLIINLGTGKKNAKAIKECAQMCTNFRLSQTQKIYRMIRVVTENNFLHQHKQFFGTRSVERRNVLAPAIWHNGNLPSNAWYNIGKYWLHQMFYIFSWGLSKLILKNSLKNLKLLMESIFPSVLYIIWLPILCYSFNFILFQIILISKFYAHCDCCNCCGRSDCCGA